MPAVADVLILGDTIRSPEARHEVPVAIPDPILYIERNGDRHAVVGSFEVPRVAALGGAVTPHAPEEYGYDDLLASGMSRDQAYLEVWVRAAQELGVRDAVVPPTFALELADSLRAEGIEVTADRGFFAERRRVKRDAELAGIRNAQRAAEAGMRAGVELLRRAETSGGAVLLDGEPLTCERIKHDVEAAFTAHDCTADESIVSHGAQTAIGHDMGSGAIAADEPIVFDLFPRDRASGCFADMTRTFVVGTPSDELREYHRLVKEALDLLARGDAARRPRPRADDARLRLLRRSTATRRSSTRSPARCSRTGSSTGSATASGSRCTSRRTSAATAGSSSPAT